MLVIIRPTLHFISCTCSEGINGPRHPRKGSITLRKVDPTYLLSPVSPFFSPEIAKQLTRFRARFGDFCSKFDKYPEVGRQAEIKQRLNSELVCFNFLHGIIRLFVDADCKKTDHYLKRATNNKGGASNQAGTSIRHKQTWFISSSCFEYNQ